MLRLIVTGALLRIAPSPDLSRGRGIGAGAVAGEYAAISQGVAVFLFGVVGLGAVFAGVQRKPYESGRRRCRRRERGPCKIMHFPRPISMEPC